MNVEEKRQQQPHNQLCVTEKIGLASLQSTIANHITNCILLKQ